VRRDARAIRGVARIAFSVVGCRLQDLRGNRWVPEDRMAKSVRDVRDLWTVRQMLDGISRCCH
jgi:hypothetical protein